jgi:phosphate transport system substrate-binding protein
VRGNARGERGARLRVFAFASALGLLVACDGAPENGLSGPVLVDGSSTVFPITEAVAEEFQRDHRRVRLTVGVSGTGGGFKRFCAGDTDIQNASREILPSEQAECERHGVEWLELRVALDGLAVVTHTGSDFVECLTIEELRRIWEPAAERTAVNWRLVRADFPDQRLQLFGPGTDSGTFDFFTEVVVGEAKASRADYTASEDDNAVVLGVSGTPGSLGYFGYAYYTENQGRLKLLAVDAGDGCVEPSDEAVADERYPLSRPLYLYVNVASVREKEQVQEFLRFYLSDEVMGFVPDVGYTPVPAAELEQTRAQLEQAIGG